MKLKILVGICCLAVCCTVCPKAFAQDTPAVEIFGGLSTAWIGSMKESINGGEWGHYMEVGGALGWSASVAFNLNDSLAIKADMSGQYTKVGNIADASLSFHNILGGVQYTKRYEKINVFGEGLVGLAMYGEKGFYGNDYLYLHKGLGMAFGGGVDWKISERVYWRVAQLDYTYARPSFTENSFEAKYSYSGFRWVMGIMIPLGSK